MQSAVSKGEGEIIVMLLEMGPTVQPRVRDPLPPFIVWNIAPNARPDQPKGVRPYWEHRMGENDNRAVWSPKSFLYWLFLRVDNNANLAGVIGASYHRESNSVWVDEPRDFLGILLNDTMLDLSKDVHVYAGTEQLTSLRLEKSKRLLEQTLDARGDPRLAFSAIVGFREDGDKWTAESCSLLDWSPWTSDPVTIKRINAF